MGRRRGCGPKRPTVVASRQQAVERAEAYLRAHIDTPVALSSLCRIVGLSERALRNAFYSVRGMSPKRCMLAERLQGVRRALTDASARPITVTDVATEYGFYELGRFAAAYKEAFGEPPSETLRGTARRRVPDHDEHGRAR
jgi:AraC family transcriptional regulator, ethanolamine operon transcriptional activator